MHPDDEERLLRSVALQNVQSILQARQRAEKDLTRIKEALEEETRVLELLNKMGATLASNLDLRSVVQTVTDAGTSLSSAQFGAFFEKATSADGTVFAPLAVSGARREAFEKLADPRATPLLAPVLRGHGVVRVGDVRDDPRTRPGLPAGYPPVRSCLAVPVISRSGDVMGALLFGHEQTDVFSERSERLIVGMAAQAAIAMDNARLYEGARGAAEERAQLLEVERAARSELERISLMKDEFLATLSHELRTPLNAVLGWSEILLARADPPAELRHGLETIRQNARAQARLIEDLLDMNRIVSGKIRLDVQRIELGPVIMAALEAVRPSVEAKALSLRSAVDPDAGPVFGDPSRLQQVVWNLLTNAVKFTPKGGAIDVTVASVSSHVEITVHDSGTGISPEFLPHVFERFRQADSSTTRRYGGLGLGLSIVKRLVELHGGTITAESPGEGRGATFHVRLPVRVVAETGAMVRPQPPDRQELIVPASEISLAGTRVLVIDDVPDARELLQAVLCDAGASVLTAESAAEGLAVVQAHRPDVIVSDIGLPGCDGYEFVRDLRRLGSTGGGRTPAIALTAFARSEDRTRAMLAGYQVHMSKPVEPQELVATIKSLAVRGEQDA